MQCDVEMMTSRWIRIPLLERLGLIGPNVFDDKYLLTDRQYRTMQRNYCTTFQNVWVHTVQCSVHTFSDVVHWYWCTCLCAAFELCSFRRFRSVSCRFRFVSCEKENEEDHLLQSIWKMVYISPMRWGHFCHSYTDSFLDDQGRVSFWDIWFCEDWIAFFTIWIWCVAVCSLFFLFDIQQYRNISESGIHLQLVGLEPSELILIWTYSSSTNLCFGLS